jgi:hypothetical protein
VAIAAPIPRAAPVTWDRHRPLDRDPLVAEPELAVDLAQGVGVLADDQPRLCCSIRGTWIEHGGLEVGQRAHVTVRLGEGLHVGDGVLAALYRGRGERTVQVEERLDTLLGAVGPGQNDVRHRQPA